MKFTVTKLFITHRSGTLRATYELRSNVGLGHVKARTLAARLTELTRNWDIGSKRQRAKDAKEKEAQK